MSTDAVVFGSPDDPIRISSLTNLQRCPGLWVLRHLEEDSTGGVAAQTGTAVGRAVEVWHNDGEPDATKVAAIEAILERVKEESVTADRPFSSADWKNVAKGLRSYALDPRNKGVVLPESQEETVVVELQAHPEDPTGCPIILRGHIDQVRFNGFRHEVWDLKNGKPEGPTMVWEYLLQQSLYTIGYAQKYPERSVVWGGIVRLQGYNTRARGPDNKLVDREPGTHPVFFRSPVRRSDMDALARMVTLAVAGVRNRQLVLSPGASCAFCPGEGVSNCRQELRGLGYDV